MSPIKKSLTESKVGKVGKEAIRVAALEQIEKDTDKTNTITPNSKNKKKGMIHPFGRLFNLSSEETEIISQKELRKAFETFDRDDSGFIDIYELKDILLSVGKNVTDEQIIEIMNEVDLDKNGVLDFDGK